MTFGDASPIAGIDWDAVTGRPPFSLDVEAIRARVHGRCVLVTGAGGSLGRPLAEAIADAGPSSLALYDHHESSLFRLRQAVLGAHQDLHVHAVLGDVRAQRRVKQLFLRLRPDVVFHLAAYKHVPWGEEDPEAFADANVLGARAVIAAAVAAEVDQIVYPSTDKAIDPPSLYGATKRVVEGMLQAAAHSGGPRCAIVRFVNVLGSQGSAPETFARQIAAGRPLSITDAAMRRFWITPDHARLMLLHAACLPDREVLVAPDAGEEILIMEIARRVFQALRPGQTPPEIAITGVRRGERLSEPLAAPHERLEPLALPGLLAVRTSAPADPSLAHTEVERIADALAAGAGPEEIRATVFAAARALQSTSQPAAV